MTESLRNLSIIIPFYGQDLQWKDLLQDLKMLPKETEILLVGPDEPNNEILSRASENMLATVRYIQSPLGRGVQLNSGARAAKNDFFWFLHADSKVPRTSLFLLGQVLEKSDANVLYYFDLQFLNDGPKLMLLNSLGANVRARYFGMPFGDQGFVVSRKLFYRIGGFAEFIPYGEDHAFVWKARRKRVIVQRIAAPLYTSARRYQLEGWGRVTTKRIYMTYLQAACEVLKLFKERTIERVRQNN